MTTILTPRQRLRLRYDASWKVRLGFILLFVAANTGVMAIVPHDLGPSWLVGPALVLWIVLLSGFATWLVNAHLPDEYR